MSPSAHHREEQYRRAAERMAEKETALASVIDRTECFSCGCRADLHNDYGCGKYK